MYIDSKLVTDVPFSPHFGLRFSSYGSPRAVHGRVLCVPKALPMDSFVDKWAKHSQFDPYDVWKRAELKAKRSFI